MILHKIKWKAKYHLKRLLIEDSTRSGLSSAPRNGKVFYNFGNFLRDQVIVAPIEPHYLYLYENWIIVKILTSKVPCIVNVFNSIFNMEIRFHQCLNSVPTRSKKMRPAFAIKRLWGDLFLRNIRDHILGWDKIICFLIMIISSLDHFWFADSGRRMWSQWITWQRSPTMNQISR